MRNLKTPLFSVSIIALTLSLSNISHAQNSTIGVNAAVKGNVTVKSAEQEAKQAVIKDDVFLGQMINSQKLSSLQILLKDETVFTVGPECELTIDKFVYDPNKNDNAMVANVTKGMFRFMSGNISNSGAEAVSVTTPTSSMGIRGTMVEGLIGAKAIEIAIAAGIVAQGTPIDAKGATLFVLRGPGINSSGKNRKGEITVTSGDHTVIVKGSNRAVFVPSAGAAPIVFSLSQTAFQNFSLNLRTVPTSLNTYRRFEIDSHFDPQPKLVEQGQTNTNSSTGSSGASAGTTAGASSAGIGPVIFGLGALGGIGALVAAGQDDDKSTSP